MAEKIINIKFPFTDSVKGFFLDTNTTSTDALKSDILNVLLTQKGERFYDPDFGTNLYQFIFEPNDTTTIEDIKNEANASLKYAMPNIELTQLSVDVTDDYIITLSLSAINNQDVFSEEIYITVDFNLS